MRALKFITGHVIYNPAYTYKFQLKTINILYCIQLIEGWFTFFIFWLLLRLFVGKSKYIYVLGH